MKNIMIPDDFDPVPFYYVYRRKRNEKWILDDTIEYYSLFVILDGDVHIEVNGKPFDLKGGDALLSPPGARRVAETKNGFKQCDIDFYAPPIEGFTEGIKIHREKFAVLCDYIDKINYIRLSEEKQCSARIKGYMLILLSEIFGNAGEKENPKAEKIKKYLTANFTHNVKMEAVAEYVGLSEAYCGTIFKKETGYTISEYVYKLRILAAVEYMKDDETVSMEEISYNLGFCDVYHFCKVFKKIMGITPGEYRKGLA